MPTKLQKIIYWLENITFFGIWGSCFLFFFSVFVGSLLPTQGKKPSFLYGDLLIELILGICLFVYIIPHFIKSDIKKKLLYIIIGLILFYLWLTYGLTNFVIISIE